MMRYPYADGPLLDDRNTYVYPDVENPEFLSAWRRRRSAALASLGTARDKDAPLGESSALRLFTSIREQSATAVTEFDRVVHRFEITKRIWPEYGEDGRAIDPEDYRQIDLYVAFAAALDAAFRRTSSLVYLNALLKALDICCAYADEVSCTGMLVQALQSELDLIESLTS